MNPNDPTDPNASPDFVNWTIFDWMNWYNTMALSVGASVAKTRFLTAWHQCDNYDIIQARSFDTNFRAWAKSNGLLNSLYAQGLGFLAEPVGWITDIFGGATNVAAHIPSAAENASGAVDEAADALKSASSIANLLIPAALVVMFIWLVKDPEKTSRATRNFAGAGRDILAR